MLCEQETNLYREVTMSNVNLQAAITFEAPPLLIRRFCLEHQVTECDAKEVFQETKKFLVLCANDRTSAYSPSKKVDEMWHQFILHSRDYFRFCDLVGGYIHHQPSQSRQHQGYTKTLEELRTIFGEINADYWGEKVADCSSCDCCP